MSKKQQNEAEYPKYEYEQTKINGGNLIMSEQEIKPCPFCGAYTRTYIGIGKIRYFECTNKKCGAMISFREYEKSQSDMEKWDKRQSN